MELCAALFIENYRRYQGFTKTQFIISPEIIDRHFNYKLGRNMVRESTHPTVGDGNDLVLKIECEELQHAQHQEVKVDVLFDEVRRKRAEDWGILANQVVGSEQL